MIKSKFLVMGITALSLSLASACSANSAEMATQNKAPSDSYFKPGAAVSYSHNLKSQMAAGETATFKLTLDEPYKAGQLSVNLTPDGDLTLFPSSTQASFDMREDGPHEMTISFTANSNGRYYINVEALAVNSSGQSRPRIFSIPVQVGAAIAQKPNVDMKTMESGENIIEMEAEEEIK
ncbi:MAG: hypothetical protein ABJN69_02285 [Hellea sp.]